MDELIRNMDKVKSFSTNIKTSCERSKKELCYVPKYDLQSMVKDMVNIIGNIYPYLRC